MYLAGMSSGDFVPALEGFFGNSAGLSASVITRLTTQWQDEHRHFSAPLPQGQGLRVRLGRRRAFQRPSRRRPAVRAWSWWGCVSTAPRNSSRSATAIASRRSRWADLLATSSSRGMPAPVLAIGDGALGFWGAVRDVWPRDPSPTRLVPQSRQRFGRVAEVGAADREEDAGGDPRRRRPRPCARRCEDVRERVHRQVAQGGREDHRRPRRAPRLLRLPGRALDPSQDVEPDRVDVRDRAGSAPRSPRVRGRVPRDSR